jgi:hypothetical protein
MNNTTPRVTRRHVLIFSLALVIGTVGWKAIRWAARDHWTNSGVIGLVGGGTLAVEHEGSAWQYHEIIPHGLGYGGGGEEQILKFSMDGKNYLWEGAFIPIVLQLDGSTPVLIVFDRETSSSKCTFRYYRWEREWKELSISSFPPQLAMQNMWLGSEVGTLPEYARTVVPEPYNQLTIKPDDPWFCRSLLAKLWFCISKGVQYHELKGQEIAPDFLAQYQQTNFPTLK